MDIAKSIDGAELASPSVVSSPLSVAQVFRTVQAVQSFASGELVQPVEIVKTFQFFRSRLKAAATGES